MKVRWVQSESLENAINVKTVRGPLELSAETIDEAAQLVNAYNSMNEHWKCTLTAVQGGSVPFIGQQNIA